MPSLIIVAFDTNKYAEKIIEYTINNIYKPGDHIAIAHIFDAKEVGSHLCLNEIKISESTLNDNTKKKLDESSKTIKHLESILKNFSVPFTTYFESSKDKVDKTILKLSAEIGASCIVVGTKRPSRLSGIFRGSISHKLSCNSKVPVVVVR
ncbi:hypothetical protein MXB_4984 [Myxobolus squamalis]|nr:hypothetical protein MXB_4984 [Myxobolus squamalis]